MRMTGYRAKALMVGVALAMLVPLTAAAGPRHEASVNDPSRTVTVTAWAQEDDGSVRNGHEIRIVPPQQGDSGQPQPPSGVPFLNLIPPPPQPGQYYVPTAEAPDLGPGQHLPDLVPLPAWDVYLDESNIGTTVGDFVLATAEGEDPFGGSQKAIRFGVTIANIGKHSLEVIGVPQPNPGGEDPARVAASQCVRFAGPRVAGSGRVCQEYQPVGSLSLHAQHGHFHIDGFAQYRLMRDKKGKPDPKAVVAHSEKVGFCMGDTDWLGKGNLAVDHGWYRECRHTAPNVPVTFRQGVSPGWGDSYGSGLPGQHLVVEGLPDGIYWIAVTVNPTNVPDAVRIFETNMNNNTSYRRVELSKGGTVARTL